MTKTPALSDIILELHVPSFAIAQEFYEKLGFEKVWEYPPNKNSGYMVMKRSQSVLSFYCGNEEVYNHSYFKKFPKVTPRGYGVEISLYISDQKIDDYYNDLKSKIDANHFVRDLELKPWGTKDFRVIDPFGFYICIREPDNILIP